MEDDPDLRRIASLMLERAGYSVIPASDSKEALELWESRGHEVELILTDLVMPRGLDGCKLAALLQELKPTLKVVYTSGYSPDIAGRRSSFVKEWNFLQKPYQPEMLLETVRRSLDGRP